MLAISIANLGEELPNLIQLFRSFNTFGQGAIFTGDCIENLENKREQIELAKEVILTATSLNFAAECYSWFRRDTIERPNPQGFSETEYNELGRILTERIPVEFSNIDKIELGEYKYLPYLMYVWNKYGNPKEAANTKRDSAIFGGIPFCVSSRG